MEASNDIHILALVCKAVCNMGDIGITTWVIKLYATYTLQHMENTLGSKKLHMSLKIKGGKSSFILL